MIVLMADPEEQVSALTAIHECLHYRNKHRGIDMTARADDGTLSATAYRALRSPSLRFCVKDSYAS